MNPNPPMRPPTTAQWLVASLLELRSSTVYPLVVMLLIMWTFLAGLLVTAVISSLFGPVSHHEVRIANTVAEWETNDYSYKAFDGSRLYPISQRQWQTL